MCEGIGIVGFRVRGLGFALSLYVKSKARRYARSNQILWKTPSSSWRAVYLLGTPACSTTANLAFPENGNLYRAKTVEVILIIIGHGKQQEQQEQQKQ